MKNFRTAFRQLNHDFTDAVRDLRRFLIKTFFGRPFRARGEVGKVEKIVVLRLDRKLGDSVTSTGFFRALHTSLPDAEITVITAVEAEKVFRGQSYLKIIANPKGIWPTIKTVWHLRKTTFDVLMDTSHLMSPKSVFLAGMLKAKKKISCMNQSYRLFSDHAEFDVDRDHVTVRYRKMLEMLGLKNADLSYFVDLPEPVQAKVDGELKKLNGTPFFVLNSFAGARMRNLSYETCQKLLSALAQAFPHHKVVSIGSPGDMRILSAWFAKGAPANWVIFPELTDFFENCALIAKSGAVISGDTSIVHVACAFKRPLVAIYRGELDKSKEAVHTWSPYGTPHALVFSTPQTGRPEQDINDFDVREVVVSLHKLAPPH